MTEQLHQPTTTFPELALMTPEHFSVPFYAEVIATYRQDPALITLGDALQRSLEGLTTEELVACRDMFDDVDYSFAANGKAFPTLRKLYTNFDIEMVDSLRAGADGTLTNRAYVFGSGDDRSEHDADAKLQQIIDSGEPFTHDPAEDDDPGEVYIRIPVGHISDIQKIITHPERQQVILFDIVENALPEALTQLNAWRAEVTDDGIRTWVEVETMLEQEAAHRKNLQQAFEMHYSGDALTLF